MYEYRDGAIYKDGEVVCVKMAELGRSEQQVQDMIELVQSANALQFHRNIQGASRSA